MHREIQNLVDPLDQSINQLTPGEIQHALANIPLDILAKIQLDRPKQYPDLIEWLPEMPEEQIQINWTGSANDTLMNQTVAFVKTIITTYTELTGKSLKDANVLDFGCGWGRIIRLLYKYVPYDQIYGVDPWDRSIDICRDTGIKANLSISDYLPRSLPTPDGLKFDFIMSFSVFTHLSENATKICLKTLTEYLSDDGVLAVTIRPIEYWNFRAALENCPYDSDQIAQLKRSHDESGFAFAPHAREKIEGEVTYGDTSISLDYIQREFKELEILRVEYNQIDSLQYVVFLQKKKT